MGAAAVPIIAQVIVSVVVSQVASKVASKVGMSDSMSSMIGMGAGMYAGSAVGAMGTGGGAAGGPGDAISNAPPGMDLSTGMAGMDLGMNAPPPGVMPSPGVSPSDLTVGGAAPPGGGLALGSQPSGGGMLTEGLGGGMTVPQSAPVGTVGTPSGSTAGRMIEGGTTVGRTGGGTEGGNWWQKLFSPEKTMDLAMAGMSGYAKAGIAKENREYPEEVAKQNAKDWQAAGTGGVNSINPTYRSQGGSY